MLQCYHQSSCSLSYVGYFKVAPFNFTLKYIKDLWSYIKTTPIHILLALYPISNVSSKSSKGPLHNLSFKSLKACSCACPHSNFTFFFISSLSSATYRYHLVHESSQSHQYLRCRTLSNCFHPLKITFTPCLDTTKLKKVDLFHAKTTLLNSKSSILLLIRNINKDQGDKII